MITCPACGEMSRPEGCCDHCGSVLPERRLSRSRALLLLGVTIGAGLNIACQEHYGVALTDASDDDGDGFWTFQGDCNDADPRIHPDAEEVAGDRVDSNCDGEDDPVDDTGE